MFMPTLLACLAWLALLPGCAGSASSTKGQPAAIVSPETARGVPILRADGHQTTWEQLVAAAADADAVLVGENHGHPLGLAAAAALWEDVLARAPQAALAMEFIERDEQSRVDDYLMGVTDEATFRKRTNRTDSNYPPGHRTMVDAAKGAHRPVIAANAPRMYVRIARLEGYERLGTLTPEQRRLFRIPDVLPQPGSRYRDDFDKVMGANEGSDPAAPKPAGNRAAPTDPNAEADRRTKLDATFRSQSVWDWTMAESVARGLEQGNAPVMLVVGRFHVDFEGGLAQALNRLRPGTHTILVSFVDRDAPMTNGAASIRDEDRGRADYVIYVGPSH